MISNGARIETTSILLTAGTEVGFSIWVTFLATGIEALLCRQDEIKSFELRRSKDVLDKDCWESRPWRLRRPQ